MELLIQGKNTNTLNIKIHVVTFGSIYQSGFIYDIDDTTDSTSNIGGKVITIKDQAVGIHWASDGMIEYASVARILGIDELSTPLQPSPQTPIYPVNTPPYVACDGKADGRCNTHNIVSYYNYNRERGGAIPTPLSFYAAGVCSMEINGYTDWYLPAVCEMGYDGFNYGSGCGTFSNPTIKNNIQSRLLDAVPTISNFDLDGKGYWTSTEYAINPGFIAWAHDFYSSGNGGQDPDGKSDSLRVRCVRDLTIN